MRDPRSKRPSNKDIFDKRHQEWLASLKAEPIEILEESLDEGPIIIKLPKYKYGKSATGLSERELEVLQLISFGRSSDEIAAKMNLSKHTITNHRKNMLKVSRCGNLPELVRIALNENLL